MTPKPEPEWRACRCAAGDPQHRPPDDPMRPCSVLGDMWYHTRDMSLWVGWDICQRCPVPDCAAALEAVTNDVEDDGRPTIAALDKAYAARRKLRGQA